MFLIIICALFAGMHAGAAVGFFRDRNDRARALRKVLSQQCGFLAMGHERAWTFLLEQARCRVAAYLSLSAAQGYR